MGEKLFSLHTLSVWFRTRFLVPRQRFLPLLQVLVRPRRGELAASFCLLLTALDLSTMFDLSRPTHAWLLDFAPESAWISVFLLVGLLTGVAAFSRPGTIRSTFLAVALGFYAFLVLAALSHHIFPLTLGAWGGYLAILLFSFVEPEESGLHGR